MPHVPMYKEYLDSCLDSLSSCNIYRGDGGEDDDTANTSGITINLVRTCITDCHVCVFDVTVVVFQIRLSSMIPVIVATVES